MRGLLGFIVFAGLALGADQTQNNALPPREAAEGWLLLFDGETSFGWTSSNADKLTVKDGVLSFDGAGTLQTTTAFCEFALVFNCRITGAKAHDDVQLVFAGQTGKIALPQEKTPSWRQGKVMVAGKDVTFFIAGGPAAPAVGKLTEAIASPLTFKVADGVKLELRDVSLLPVGQKPLFNGKNLDGWKEFAGKKYVSKFSVNDKLELNLKNGPGDLQTEAQYADFCMQIECFCNGKYLNSGVFFRCKPNEYQNGYETDYNSSRTKQRPTSWGSHGRCAQIDRQEKSAIHDPPIAAPALIYRRIPARKDVAKDGEWFTMTIIAHGTHMATWVNGVQEVDWDDNRPPNDNPRNGCRLEAGHISLQAHDPTTDLSFRNIRIAEYPKKGRL